MLWRALCILLVTFFLTFISCSVKFHSYDRHSGWCADKVNLLKIFMKMLLNRKSWAIIVFLCSYLELPHQNKMTNLKSSNCIHGFEKCNFNFRQNFMKTSSPADLSTNLNKTPLPSCDIIQSIFVNHKPTIIISKESYIDITTRIFLLFLLPILNNITKKEYIATQFRYLIALQSKNHFQQTRCLRKSKSYRPCHIMQLYSKSVHVTFFY